MACYQSVPDGEYRLINWNGQTDYLPKQYFTFKGNEFGAFVIDRHGEHGDKISLADSQRSRYYTLVQYTFLRLIARSMVVKQPPRRGAGKLRRNRHGYGCRSEWSDGKANKIRKRKC